MLGAPHARSQPAERATCIGKTTFSKNPMAKIRPNHGSVFKIDVQSVVTQAEGLRTELKRKVTAAQVGQFWH